MRIYFLGTCAGTEPITGRKHMSFAIESKGHIYWFDAGEGCSYTAHLAGVDLLRVDKVIISHTHMDHVGGLGNLLWNIRKISYMRSKLPEYGDIDLYIPNMETWEGVWKILKNTEGGYKADFKINANQVKDGILFDDGIMKVKAYHNHHFYDNTSEPWLSYTYRIESEGKSLVYSGDVGKYEDMDDAIGEGCSGLIIETGHYGIDTAYAYIKNKNINSIFFSHNGREIINFPVESAAKVHSLFQDKALICEDGLKIEF